MIAHEHQGVPNRRQLEYLFNGLSRLTKKTHQYKNVRALCIIGFCEENQIISLTKGQYYNVLLGKVLVAIEEMITYVAFALISWDHIYP